MGVTTQFSARGFRAEAIPRSLPAFWGDVCTRHLSSAHGFGLHDPIAEGHNTDSLNHTLGFYACKLQRRYSQDITSLSPKPTKPPKERMQKMKGLMASQFNSTGQDFGVSGFLQEGRAAFPQPAYCYSSKGTLVILNCIHLIDTFTSILSFASAFSRSTFATQPVIFAITTYGHKVP